MCAREISGSACFFVFNQWSFKLNFRHVCNLWSAWLSQSCQNERPIHETQLGPVSKVTNMEYIAAKTRDCLKIDGTQWAAMVQWLLVNGKKKYMREIVSDNHKCKWDSCCVWTWSKNIFLCSLYFWKAHHWYSGFHRSYSSSWYTLKGWPVIFIKPLSKIMCRFWESIVILLTLKGKLIIVLNKVRKKCDKLMLLIPKCVSSGFLRTVLKLALHRGLKH